MKINTVLLNLCSVAMILLITSCGKGSYNEQIGIPPSPNMEPTGPAPTYVYNGVTYPWSSGLVWFVENQSTTYANAFQYVGDPYTQPQQRIDLYLVSGMADMQDLFGVYYNPAHDMIPVNVYITTAHMDEACVVIGSPKYVSFQKEIVMKQGPYGVYAEWGLVCH